MYNADKFHWLPLQPGTERFVMNRGPFGNFDTSNLTPEQSSVFFGTTATVAESGVKLRTLYVWESDTDRFTYVYSESGKIIAAYPPLEDYDPHALARKQIESDPNITPERRDFLLKFLDPTRVVLSAAVADGPIPISPSIFEPTLPGEAPLPGGFGMLGFDPEGPEPASRNVATWEEGLGPKLTFDNPGKGSYIPMWRTDGPDFTADYTWLDQLEDVGSDSAEHTDEDAVELDSRYYYTPFLDTTYVQVPSADSLTLKYVAPRNVTVTAWLWKPGAWTAATSQTAQKEPSEGLGSGIYVYKAIFSGLDADTTYKYLFEWEQGGSDEHTAVQTTRTWPEQQDITEFSFIVYGDNRGDNNHNFQTLHRDVVCLGALNQGLMLEPDYPPFLLHTGDLVYQGGDEEQWIPHFFRPAGALLSCVPVFPCVGNHELGGDSSASNYRDLFTLPDVDPEDPNDAERWYSFDYGRCHFISLDAYSDFSSTSDQYDWLIRGGGKDVGDLPTAWRRKVLYGTLDRIFVWLHFPPYSSGPHGTKTQQGDPVEYQKRMDLRQYLVPKFEYYKVDVAFSGHEHLYERVSKGGVQYVVTGGGGAPGHSIDLGWDYDGTPGAVREAWYDKDRTDKGDWHHHCRISVSANGDVVVDVFNNEHTILDSFEIP